MSVVFLLLFCRNLSSPSPSFSFFHSKKERQQTHRAKGGVERNRRGRGRGMAPRGSSGGRGRRRGRRRQPPLRVELRKVLLLQVSPGDGLARRSADHQQEAPAMAVSYCVVSGGRNELFFRSLDLSRSLARSDPRAPDRNRQKKVETSNQHSHPSGTRNLPPAAVRTSRSRSAALNTPLTIGHVLSASLTVASVSRILAIDSGDSERPKSATHPACSSRSRATSSGLESSSRRRRAMVVPVVSWPAKS